MGSGVHSDLPWLLTRRGRAALSVVLSALGLALVPAGARATTTFTVTTTNDSGPGSLRQAITDANAATGGTIDFSIGAQGSSQEIQPGSQLPTITAKVVIDGFTQGGSSYKGPPLIQLDGTNAGSGADGFLITGGSSTLEGLEITDFTDNGSSCRPKARTSCEATTSVTTARRPTVTGKTGSLSIPALRTTRSGAPRARRAT